MQQCGNCFKVYDESEFSHCPYCSGLLDDDDYDEDDYDEDYEDEEQEFVVTDELRKFWAISRNPGVFNEDGEYIRCKICNHGLSYYKGVPTCPNCGEL